MPAISIQNAESVTQFTGTVVRTILFGSTLQAVAAFADNELNLVKVLGVRISDVAAGGTGYVAPLEPGVRIRMAAEPNLNDPIYISATTAGIGVTIAPTLGFYLGTCLAKEQVGGVWFATSSGVSGGSSNSGNPTAGDPQIASWSTAIIRYFFVDIANGNDTNVGYIDAAAGATFIPAQTTPVAIQTMARLGALLPKIGAGRAFVVLVRAGSGFTYDLHDRSKLSGYRYMLLRGSDFTNSTSDKRICGFTTAVPGPNANGSYTITNVAYVSATTRGFDVSLAAIAGYPMPVRCAGARFRIRVIRPSNLGLGENLYSCIYSNGLDAAQPRTFVAIQSENFTPAANDQFFFESPGAVLAGFHEATNVDADELVGYGPTGSNNFSNNTAANVAGIAINATLSRECRLGLTGSPAASNYAGLFVDSGLSSDICVTNSNAGHIQCRGAYTDETSTVRNIGIGLSTGTINSGAFQGGASDGLNSIALSHSTIVRTASTAILSRLKPRQFAYFNQSTIQFLEIKDAPGGMSFVDCAINTLSASGKGECTLSGTEMLHTNATPSFLFGFGYTTTSNFEITLGLFTSATWLPAVLPASNLFSFAAGRMSVFWALPPISEPLTDPGTGVSLVPAAGMSSISINWNSLRATGFDLINGVKMQVTYMDAPRPCPKCTIFRSGQTIPTGSVVRIAATSSNDTDPYGSDYVRMAWAGYSVGGANVPDCDRIVGVTVTPINATFGLVACEGFLAVRVGVTRAVYIPSRGYVTLPSGTTAYLAGTGDTDGTVSNSWNLTARDHEVILGTVVHYPFANLPYVGTGYVVVAWAPQHLEVPTWGTGMP